MSSSDLSELSSALSTDNDIASEPNIPGALDHYFQSGSSAAKQASPPAKKKRPASPPHEYVLADNPDIAVSQTLGIPKRGEILVVPLKPALLILCLGSSSVYFVHDLITLSQNPFLITGHKI